MDAGTLHCPTCGAAATSDATQCAYCKARLATAACPSCFGMVFAGTRFCPHCGARGARADEGDGTEAERPCPRCKVGLHVMSIGEVRVRECGSCAGLWVDAETLTEITGERERQAAVLASLGGSGLPVQAPAAEVVRYAPCPQCGKLMNRVNFARYSGVVVDVCRGHGTWFDADELRRIIEFIRSGGLEMAREKERIFREEELRRLQVAAQRTGLPPEESSGGGWTLDASSVSLLRNVVVDGLAAPLWSAIRSLVRGL